jgi:hypothetical protein
MRQPCSLVNNLCSKRANTYPQGLNMYSRGLNMCSQCEGKEYFSEHGSLF